MWDGGGGGGGGEGEGETKLPITTLLIVNLHFRLFSFFLH